MPDFFTTFSNSAGFNTNFGVITEVAIDDYTGEYSAIPSQVQQVFPTENTKMTADFVVEPIPSCYGLVEWNGFSLKIS